MLARPTTFVLGAGASHDLNLPTGDGLQHRISALLHIDSDGRRFSNNQMWEAVLPNFQGVNWAPRAVQLANAAAKIRRGMPAAASIDNFLHTHQDDADVVMIGKLAIALAILEAEAASYLLPTDSKQPFETQQFRESWYHPFIRMLTMGSLSQDPQALFGNAKFVIFNYDRCLELVLIHVLKSYFGLDEGDALQVLSRVEIIHPYGSLGPLTGADGVQFGHLGADLNKVAGGLRTFTESVDTDTLQRARTAVARTDVLVFLGFGFLPQNMELIAPGEERLASRVHATTLGFSATDKIVLKGRLAEFIRADVDEGDIQFVAPGSTRSGFIDIENNTCTNLISNHRMRLT